MPASSSNPASATLLAVAPPGTPGDGPVPGSLGVTLPAGDPLAALVIEALITFWLMYVILAVATGPKERGLLAALAIGGAVTLAAAVFGPLTGASMNPARTLGPAIVAREFSHLWLYLIGPSAGAAVAAVVHACVTPLRAA